MELFSVQRIIGKEAEPLGRCITVEAKCPLGAGEMVLAQPLALHGEVPLARIWYLKDDFTPESVNLYAAARAPAR